MDDPCRFGPDGAQGAAPYAAARASRLPLMGTRAGGIATPLSTLVDTIRPVDENT